jgi:polyisoprenoid-binding protein YceI
MCLFKSTGLSLFFAGLCFQAVAQPAAEKIYLFDTNHTTLGFAVPIMALGEVTGKFTDFTGRVVVPAENDLTKATVEVTIKTSSIDTGNEDRDKHLRNTDFFDAENYPEITFKSKKITKLGGSYSLTGDFTMRGVTKEIVIPVQITGHGKSIGARASFPLNRKDYGISYSRIMDDGSAFVSDQVMIELRLLTRTGKTVEELAEAEAAKKDEGAKKDGTKD